MNSSYLNYSKYKISAETDNFDSFDQLCPKRTFPSGTGKSEHHH